MKTQIFLWLLPVLLTTEIRAQTPNFVWTGHEGLFGRNEGIDITLDKSGNVLAIWNSQNSGYLTKLDANGAPLWQRKTGDYARGVAVDESGNVIVVADSLSLTSGPSRDVFIYRYWDDGELAWLKQGGINTGEDLPHSVAVDVFGDVIATGDFEGTATFADTSLTAANLESMFLVKYNLDGDLLWASVLGRLERDSGRDIATDKLGNILVMGRSYDNAFEEMFLAKFDRGGQLLWQRSFPTIGQGLTLDYLDNILVVGSFEGQVSIGDTTLTTSGDGDLLVLKYDPAGNLLWARKEGGTLDDGDYGDIKADADGNVFIVSSIEGTAVFGDTTLVSEGFADVVLAKYDPDGEFRWVLQGGGLGQDNGTGIALAGDGGIFITGHFEDRAKFGETILESDGLSDAFVATFRDTEITAIGQNAALPQSFLLLQNYPNPFNPETTLRYSLPRTSDVQMTIYNTLGNKIRTLINSRQFSGDHHIRWDGRDDAGLQVASGVYLCKLQAGGFSAMKKMLLIQ